jgi:tungstate transport system ATP-binding protein
MFLGPIDAVFGGTGLTVVVGPNGSGKTTLLRVLHGVERLSSGTIDWAVPIETARHAQAYVFQTPILLRRSVAGNLAYPLVLNGTRRAAREAAVADWADKVGLRQSLRLPAARLSGGERQKLALARALIRAPKVLFLDEPCANLDGHATREIEALLTQISAAGTRIIMATHDMGQARRLADDAIFLLRGRIHEQTDTQAFFASPRSSELRAFLNGDIVT